MNAMIGKRWYIVVFCVFGMLAAIMSLPATSRAAGEHILYSDGLSSGWQNWSWGGTYTFDSTAEVRTGSRAIAVTHTQAWSGAYLAYPNFLDTTEYTTLRFWIHGGSSGNQTITVNAIDDSNTWVGNTTIQLVANTWVEHEISLATLGNPTLLAGIVFQDGIGGAQPTYYIDDVALLIDDSVSITPTPPAGGSGEETLAVNILDVRHTISDGIYGMNFADAATASDLDLGVNRWGGNAVTRYNYQTDVSNRASDWYFLNVPNSVTDESALPNGSAADSFVERNQTAGSATMMTMPLIGYTPNGRNWDCGFPRSQYPNQDSWDPYRPNCGNGQLNGADLAGNAVNTSQEINEEWVIGWINHLTSRYGTAAQGGVQFYSLDNEPMLWHHTHRDIHPEPVSYDEIVDLSQRYGAAIKSADSTAATVGPAVWGWTAYTYSALDSENGDWNSPDDANAHGGLPFLEYYLQEMAAYEATHGTRILDYLDLHFYPQGSGVALTTAGNQATQELRLRQTRALWDPTYLDESWIGDHIQLIPRMKGWVDTRYPNTKLSISEYNFGGVEHINGAVAQAEVLGILGREGVDMATMWDPPTSGQPAMYAFRMFRNYDGNGSKFGDVSLGATSTDLDNLSMFAARRSSDNAITLMIVNKSFEAQTANINLANLNGQTIQQYQYSASNLNQIVRLDDTSVTEEQHTVALSAQSMMLLVINAPVPEATGNDIAIAEETQAGLVGSGDFGSTWRFDGEVERLHEGKDGSLQHQWQFSVLSGGSTLYLNAWVDGSAENEEFTFEYSTDGTTFTPMVTVGGSERALTKNYILPASVSGTVYVRVVDSAPVGDNSLNTLVVDYMEFQAGSVPTAVQLGTQSTHALNLNILLTVSGLFALTLLVTVRKSTLRPVLATR